MSTERPPSPSRARRLAFAALTATIPLLFFGLLEGILALVGYGESFPLVLRAERFGEEKAFFNPEVARRYFDLPPGRVPAPPIEVFDPLPAADELRVLCLGGSTTAGFPFELNATFPFQLESRLRRALPDRPVEVINVGISAVNSFTVLDLVPELLELEPDLVVVYMGHNEFYGALGVASTQSFAGNRWVVRTVLRLRELRFVQLLDSLLRRARASAEAGETGEADGEPSMMRAMSGGRLIARDSRTFRRAVSSFEGNLEEIVDSVRDAGVSVVLSTLVSNLRDQPPFVAELDPSLDGAALERARRELAEASEALAQGRPARADELAEAVLAVDPTQAQAHYLRGRALLELGAPVLARRHLEAARDHDRLRFRAPSEMNEAIRRIARERDVPLVDLDAVFAAASPGGAPGADWFVEHLHPTFDGYRLMAEAILRGLEIQGALRSDVAEGFREELLSPDDVESVLATFRRDDGGVTELDLEIGFLRGWLVTHQWPFEERPVRLAEYRPVGSELTLDLAMRRLRENLFWRAAHVELANAYLDRGRPAAARRELLAVHRVFEDDPLPMGRLGDVHLLESVPEEAARWYRRALERARDPELRAALAERLSRAEAAAAGR